MRVSKEGEGERRFGTRRNDMCVYKPLFIFPQRIFCFALLPKLILVEIYSMTSLARFWSKLQPLYVKSGRSKSDDGHHRNNREDLCWG